MLLAVVTSAIFLACYLVYHYQAGSMPFRHAGAVRLAYFTILLSHTVLATFGVVPLVIVTFVRAARRDFREARSNCSSHFSHLALCLDHRRHHLPVALSSAHGGRPEPTRCSSDEPDVFVFLRLRSAGPIHAVKHPCKQLNRPHS